MINKSIKPYDLDYSKTIEDPSELFLFLISKYHGYSFSQLEKMTVSQILRLGDELQEYLKSNNIRNSVTNNTEDSSEDIVESRFNILDFGE